MKPDVFDKRYTEYQVDRSALRKLVRQLYLNRAASLLRGPTLDFGCGVGELLARLPAGSRGVEYNRTTVEYCRSMGLDVDWYDGTLDEWQLSTIPDSAHFESMVISHVLEHLEEPNIVLRKLLLAASRFGIRRVLVIVPGKAGFKIDDTHLTFIDDAYLADSEIVAGTAFCRSSARYFPFNLRRLGDWLPHHELQVVFRSA